MRYPSLFLNLKKAHGKRRQALVIYAIQTKNRLVLVNFGTRICLDQANSDARSVKFQPGEIKGRLSMKIRAAICAFALLIAPATALAEKADVVGVEVRQESPGVYRFNVTVKSDDTGWEKYADKWEVLSPDGEILGERILLHPHENEQPFTRSLSGVAIPAGVTSVRIRAHDKIEGYGGKEMTVELPD